MTESKMAEVAKKIFGVELEEKFKIKNIDEKYIVNSFCFDERGLKNGEAYLDATFIDLLVGNKEIIKFPWKPKENENYYTFTTTPYGCYTIVCAKWNCSFIDKMRYRNGFCYKTREEAEADKARAEEFFNSDDIINWE